MSETSWSCAGSGTGRDPTQIDNPQGGDIPSKYAHPYLKTSTIGSDRDVLRPGPTFPNRLAMIALAILAWLATPVGSSPVRAAGCHVLDRPVLGIDLPGQADRHIAAWEMTEFDEVAPSILERVPCPDETPQIPATIATAIWAASLPAMALEPDSPSGLLQAIEDIESLDPHPFLLERPPR